MIAKYFIRYAMLGVVVFSLVAAGGCKSAKKSGKSPLIIRAWHDMNTRYNSYYNANLRIDKSVNQLNAGYKDNFNQVLPMYPYAAVDNAQAVKQLLDEAIQKNTIALELHKKHTVWADDAYLLVGISEFLKKDYEKSKLTFHYITVRYTPYKKFAQMTKEEKKEVIVEQKKSAQEEKAKLLKDKKKAREEAMKKKEKERREKEKAKKKAKKKGKKAAWQKGKSKPNSTTDKGSNPWDTKEKVEELVEIKEDKKPETGDKGKKDDDEVKEEKKLKYPLKRRHAYWAAMLWEARACVEINSFDEAHYLLNVLEGDRNFPKKLKPEAKAVRAHIFLRQKHYAKAIEPLKQAIAATKNKKAKTRYTFILAQLYKLEGMRKESGQMYANVLKLSPDYAMEFNARVNKALNGDSNPIGALKTLLKDTKNEEFKDQVYYALGEIERESENYPAAVAYYNQSIQASVDNNAQKSEAYYRLGSYYHKKEDFVKAVRYYDSTLTLMAKNDERYPELKKYVENLGEIATNLEVIQLQDSLLAINKMTPEEQKELAKKIKKQNLDKALSEEARDEKMQDIKNASAPVISANALSKSSFALYNEKDKTKNQKEFQRKWGMRPLVDNWRRSSAINAVATSSSNGEGVKGELLSIGITQAEVDAILASVPKTEADVKAANDRIQKAYFALGKLYRDKLNDYKKAAKAFETMLQRYPGCSNEEEALFYLYLIQTELNNSNAADAYKQQLISKYPEGKLAKSLSDPNFLASLKNRRQLIDAQYEIAYQLLQVSNYDSATAVIQAAEAKWGANHELASKFALLNAMCVGGLKGKELYIQALKSVRTSYPNTQEDKTAANMLKLLGDVDKPQGNGNKTPEGAKAGYKFDEKDAHFVLVWLKTPNANMDLCRRNVADYIDRYNSNEGLKTTSLLLDKDQFVTVRKFKDKNAAMQFIENAKRAPTFIDRATVPDFTMWAVGQINYATLVTNKDLEVYEAFFKENY